MHCLTYFSTKAGRSCLFRCLHHGNRSSSLLEGCRLHGACYVSFILGKAKLAPLAAYTVPQLELGAAVLAVELSEFIVNEMGMAFHALEFYTDSSRIGLHT